MCVPLTRDRSRNPLAPLRFGRMPPNPLPAFWAGSGVGSDPPPIGRSASRKPGACNAGCFGFGGRSQPAPAARFIPAGRLRARLGGGWRGRPATARAAAWSSKPTPASSHRSPRPLTALWPGSWATWSRRVSASPKATGSAGVRWAATTTVRRCARRAPLRGSGGGAPGPPGAPAAAREAGGSKGGAAPPRQSPVFNTG